MPAANDFQGLLSENELLKIQLNDLEYLIHTREEELELLRKQAADAIKMKSLMEIRLLDIEQMQNNMSEAIRREEAGKLREANLDKEIKEILDFESQYADLFRRLKVAQNELHYLSNELDEANRQVHISLFMKSRIAELESRLALAEQERDRIGEELGAIKQIITRETET